MNDVDKIILNSVSRTLNESKQVKVINKQIFELMTEENDFDFTDISAYGKKIDQFGRDIGGERGEKIANIGRNIGIGVAKSQAKKRLAKEIIKQLTKKAASFTALTGKSIPVLGDVLAIIDGLIEGVIFAKSLKTATDLLLDVSSVELEGIRSVLGQYSILEASSDDIEKIANVLEEKALSGQLLHEETEEIREHYFEAMRSLKGLIINLLMLAKYLGGPAAIGAAIVAYITPVELGAKELIYYLHTKIEDVKDLLDNSEYGVIRLLGDILEMTQIPGAIVPLIGFLSDSRKVTALGRIDDVLTGEFQEKHMLDYSVVSAAEHMQDMNSSDRFSREIQKGSEKIANKFIGTSMKMAPNFDYGKALANLSKSGYGGLSESKQTLNKNVDLNRWQKLSGIN